MEIYAEISQKTLKEIEEEGRDFIWPEGVKWSRRWGSRACFLECEEDNKDILIDFLDSKRVLWQIISEDSVTDKKDKSVFRGFSELNDPWKTLKDFGETKDPWRSQVENN